MSFWAVLEGELNSSVHKLCGLSGLEAVVATANMGVRDKANTVRTMLYVAHSTDAPKVAENNKIMDRIGERSTDRNLVAHTNFFGHADGVQFLVIKAKGKFQIPPTIWTVEDFRNRNRLMMASVRELRAAVAVAVEWRGLIKSRLAGANIFATTQGTNALTGLLGLGHLAQENPDSLSPSPTEAPQTPKAPRKKSEGLKKR